MKIWTEKRKKRPERDKKLLSEIWMIMMKEKSWGMEKVSERDITIWIIIIKKIDREIDR